MTILAGDTQPDVERILIERLRQMPTWRKMALVGEMNRTVRTFALAGIRRCHPEDTPEQQQRRLADLSLGTELAARAYGPFPTEN
jgi:hypothetical protein